MKTFKKKKTPMGQHDSQTPLRDTGAPASVHRRTTSFLGCMERMIAEARAQKRLGAVHNLQSAANRFASFLGESDLSFRNLTPDLLRQFENQLKAEGLKRNSTSFYMRQLRAVFCWAGKRGWVAPHIQSPFEAVYTGVDRTRKRAVDLQVIRKLMLLDLRFESSLAWARDMFLLSFFMRGIPFVDMAFLKKSNVCNGAVRYERRKTGTPMEVCLEPCMKAIIGRYEDRTSHSPYLLPILSETEMEKAYRQYHNRLSYYNKLLKQLSAMLGDDNVHLTSYVARHTWATSARRINIALPVISAAMGHASEVTTQIYLASIEASMVDEANRSVLEALMRCI